MELAFILSVVYVTTYVFVSILIGINTVRYRKMVRKELAMYPAEDIDSYDPCKRKRRHELHVLHFILRPYIGVVALCCLIAKV